MSFIEEKFAPFAKRMQAIGLPDVIIKTFEYYYTQLVEGHTGFIAETDIHPVENLPDVQTFAPHLEEVGEAALPKTILLKLNGGLGTNMGMEHAKTLLTAKQGLTFLDIIVWQARHAAIPLMLMNSFVTHKDSLTLLEHYPDMWKNIPLDFVQHRVPKITQIDLSPVNWPTNPDLEWCPPGHGDVYTALITTGILDILLQAGYEFAFVSNADNLGAVVDKAILGYFVENSLPFMMEVTDRTEADRKGGHLAQLPNGQLVLREAGQCPPTDYESFQDINHHKYFNTNNLWLNLKALKTHMVEQDNILKLPMIRNAKTVDARDNCSTPVYQLETAMGSAIAIFDGAQAVHVPRARFAPVKTTEDLLAVRSDIYILTTDFWVIPNPARQLKPITISLDHTYYHLIKDMETRFPHGAPSLLECQSLMVKGDIKFGQNIILKGDVQLINRTTQQVKIEDGAILTGESQWQ